MTPTERPMLCVIDQTSHRVSEIDGRTGAVTAMCGRTAHAVDGIATGDCVDCDTEDSRRRAEIAGDMTSDDLAEALDRLDADYQIMRERKVGAPWFVQLAARESGDPTVVESGATLAEAMGRALEHFGERRREGATGAMPLRSDACAACLRPGLALGETVHGACARAGEAVSR